MMGVVKLVPSVDLHLRGSFGYWGYWRGREDVGGLRSGRRCFIPHFNRAIGPQYCRISDRVVGGWWTSLAPVI